MRPNYQKNNWYFCIKFSTIDFPGDKSEIDLELIRLPGDELWELFGHPNKENFQILRIL